MPQPVIRPVEEPREQYRGRLIRIITQRMELPDGRIVPFERAERAPGVRILVASGANILLTREWRSETECWDFRLPGGKVFESLDDYLRAEAQGGDVIPRSARFAAQKELREETSLEYPVEAFEPFHRSVCGATVVWDLFFFLVEGGHDASRPLAGHTTEEGENIHPQWLSHAEVKRLCLAGEVKEDRTVAVLLRFVMAAEKGIEVGLRS